MNNDAIISAVGLTKVFKDFWRRARVKAVNDLDLEVRPGEIYGLLGPNGSGKSTTIKIILGLLNPTRGRVTVFGRPPDDVKTKSRIGYLPEESYLYRYLNGREVLNFYGSLFQISRRDRKKRTEELLEMVGLGSAARRPVGEYSKGMARRIGLAQALINDPDLLILDEPTSGLDPIGANLVKDVILRISREFGKTVLLSSHLLADVEEVCERVTILYGGQTQVTGRMADVLSRRDLTQITCDRLSEETIREMRALVERRDGKSFEVTTPRDRLESLFLRIVREAQAARIATDGTAAEGNVAAFLGEEGAGAAALEKLVKVGPDIAATRAKEPAAAVPAAADASVLDGLSQEVAPPPAEAKAPAAPAKPQVDAGVLDDLLGEPSGDGDKERP